MDRRFDLIEVILSVAKAMDLAAPALADHHKRVAYVAARLAGELDLPPLMRQELFMAALLHDAGAFRLKERLSLLEFEETDGDRHCVAGASLVETAEPVRMLAPLLRHHHTPWRETDAAVRASGACVLHLADRISVTVTPGAPDPGVAEQTVARVRGEAGGRFDPDAVEAFTRLAEEEAFWFDLASTHLDEILAQATEGQPPLWITLAEFREMAKFLCAVVDFRSPFTATHSRGVGATAEALAERLGWHGAELLEVEAAGLLHDIGKLSVPETILEKPGPLTPRERWVMMQHPYHTHRVLRAIRGAEQIDRFASYHHEHANGGAYPFHRRPEELSDGARLMAVADVFTALTEERPYRKPSSSEAAVRELRRMARDGQLNARLVESAADHRVRLNEARRAEQAVARRQYRELGEQGARLQ